MNPGENPIPQQRLEQLQYGLEHLKEDIAKQVRVKVAVAEARFTQKQDNTDRALAILMDGQAQLLERSNEDADIYTAVGERRNKSRLSGE